MFFFNFQCIALLFTVWQLKDELYEFYHSKRIHAVRVVLFAILTVLDFWSNLVDYERKFYTTIKFIPK